MKKIQNIIHGRTSGLNVSQISEGSNDFSKESGSQVFIGNKIYSLIDSICSSKNWAFNIYTIVGAEMLKNWGLEHFGGTLFCEKK
jgi:hypothetical protein